MSESLGEIPIKGDQKFEERPDGVREQLATLAHEQWAGWMEYLFSKSDIDADGGVYIPVSLAHRWKRQMNTPYTELPEKEKESDRREADRVLALLHELCWPVEPR